MKKKEIDNTRIQRSDVKEEIIFPLPDKLVNLPASYQSFIEEIKVNIKKARQQAIISANSDMIVLYWKIGKTILEKQDLFGWGAKVIDRIAYDLKNEFSQQHGFSPRNLKYMRNFAQAYPDFEIVQRTVAQIPWRSNIVLLEKIQDYQIRLWYAKKTIENGYSKDVLVHQIESQLYQRIGTSINNFPVAMPPLESDLTNQSFKDPYLLDFLGTSEISRESELENKLISHIQKFLLELGQGFAFVGRQVHVELGNKDYYIDLLFYHLKLRCYVVVELKTGEFQPEYISKLNIYLNVVNDVLRYENDNPTIGLFLVKSKNKLVVEYSLTGYTNPISVANWETDILNSIPDNIKYSLPTIEEIEKELEIDF